MNTAPSAVERSAHQRIEVIRLSLRYFVYSLLGLVPLLGLPFALAALGGSRKLRAAAGGEWNPAERYLTAARRLALLGFLTSIAALVLLSLVLPEITNESCSGSSGFG